MALIAASVLTFCGCNNMNMDMSAATIDNKANSVTPQPTGCRYDQSNFDSGCVFF